MQSIDRHNICGQYEALQTSDTKKKARHHETVNSANIIFMRRSVSIKTQVKRLNITFLRKKLIIGESLENQRKQIVISLGLLLQNKNQF